MIRNKKMKEWKPKDRCRGTESNTMIDLRKRNKHSTECKKS